MNDDKLAYYQAGGPFTRIPPECAEFFRDMPSDIPGVCELVQMLARMGELESGRLGRDVPV